MYRYWDERYLESDFAYGKEPNDFFKTCLQDLLPGKLLLAAEGEGRNAFWALCQGFEVKAYDSSSVGKNKALQLAVGYENKLDYQIASHLGYKCSRESMDVIGIIYAHMDSESRKKVHYYLSNCLKSGGHLILEAFSKAQLGKNSGGPKTEELLYDLSEVQSDFPDFYWKVAENTNRLLNEGKYHQGKAEVIQLFGRKK